MVLLKIISEENDLYKLKKNNNQLSPVYEFLFDFYGVEKPVVGTTILIHENLLNKKYEGYCKLYSFEHYMELNKDSDATVEGTEYLVLYNNNKKIVMKRIYG